MAGKNVLEDDRKGKVLQGTCGWSDSSIVKCGRFYPASVKTSEDRLLHYSRFFPCVECDSSNYAIPSPAAVEKWVKCVPAGFKFHFKAFGFFTRKVRVYLWERSFRQLCIGSAYWGGSLCLLFRVSGWALSVTPGVVLGRQPNRLLPYSCLSFI